MTIKSHERVLQRNNVIVGLPDDSTQASIDNEVRKMLAGKLKLQLRFEAMRLGKKVGEKSRPVPVQFQNQKTKWSVLRKQAMLKATTSTSMKT